MAMTNDEIAKWLATLSEAVLRIDAAVSKIASKRQVETLTVSQRRFVDREKLRKARESYEKYCRETDCDIG
jgi:hypothetical protein